MKAKLITTIMTLLISVTGANANDWTMGDWMPVPQMNAFLVRIVKSTPAQGRTKVHTAVAEVQRVIKGSIGKKRVGIVLPMERYKNPPPVGSEFFVMSGSSRSPYSPAWMMHGYVRLDEGNGQRIIPCAELSAKYVAAQTTSERVSILKEIEAIEKTSCGYEVASRLPVTSCKVKMPDNQDRNKRMKEYNDCLKEYGATVK